MKNSEITLLLVCLLLLPTWQAQADLTSTFDAGPEGWGIAGNGSGATPDYESTGGNPGGFIKDSDVGSNFWYFVAPSTWSGDLSGYVGGILSYDIIVLYASQAYVEADDVRIWGGDPAISNSPYLYWNSGIVPTTPPNEAWTPFSVEINADNFALRTFAGGPPATFESIMADVHAIHIRGEFQGAGDTEGIDNVRLQAADATASAPTLSEWSMILFIILLVGSALWVARRRTGVASV